jgi:hypothetical protein
VGEDGAPRVDIRLREIALAWTLIAFVVAEAIQAEWIAALAVPFGVALFLVGWAVRVPDRTQKIKKWIVVGFTVCAYLMQAPIYAERPYEAVGHWIGLFSLEMLLISSLLWFLLKDWRTTLTFLAAVILLIAALAIGLIAVSFLVTQAVRSPFRSAVIVLLVVVATFLYKILKILQRRA